MRYNKYINQALEVLMQVHYDIEKLSAIARDLYELLHLSVLIIDRDGNRIAKCHNPRDFCSVMQEKDPSVLSGCHESDAQLVEKCRASGRFCMQICHMNLCDVALPIVKDGVQVAYVMLGRMHVSSCRDSVPVSDPELRRLYGELPTFSDRELESLTSLLSIILFGGAITTVESDSFDEIKSYIENNLSSDISVSALCKRFFISKNTLYRLFREECGVTPGEFVSQRRIDEAKRLLVETSRTACAIGGELGFDSYSYFCRFFKDRVGVTPTEFRRASR